MNLGLGNLSTLKSYVLPPDQEDATDFDDALALIGLGVAGMIEKQCNRKFQRQVGAQAEFRIAQQTFTLPIYPIEEVSAVELRANATDDWAAQNLGDIIAQITESAGLVEMWPRWAPPLLFLYPLGGLKYARVRVTWTGGYWFDESEDGSGTLPEGAAPLPGDLSLAWLMQCAFIWQRKDKLGVPLASGSEKTRYDTLGQEPFTPQVSRILAGYTRFQII